MHLGIENSENLRDFFRDEIEKVNTSKNLEIQAKTILDRFIEEFGLEKIKMRDMVEFTILEEIEIRKKIQIQLFANPLPFP